MRISGSDKNDIYSKYRLISEAGSVTNTGEGTPSVVKGAQIDVGNSSQWQQRQPGAGDNSGPGGGAPQSPAGISQDEEEDCNDEATSMAKTQLLSCADKALELFDMLHNQNVEFEAWEAAKLTLAADYIETVYDVVKYRGSKEDSQMQEVETDQPIEVNVSDEDCEY